MKPNSSSGSNNASAAANLGDKPGANVLLIVWDTIRADATSLLRQDRDTTPTLKALAGTGIWYDRAIAPSSWTLPSHASMFTGRNAEALNVGAYAPLDDRYPVLAEELAARGYRTGGFVGNTVLGSTWHGLDRGFGQYDDYVATIEETVRSSSLGWLLFEKFRTLWTRSGLPAGEQWENRHYRKDADLVNQQFLHWLDNRLTSEKEKDQPWFAFVNLFDAHAPYVLPTGAGPEPPRFGKASQTPTPAERQVLRDWDVVPRKAADIAPGDMTLARDGYDTCLGYLDDRLGRLIAALESRGALDRTWVIITSDHGENFGDHGLTGHRFSVYQSEVHVPLLIVPPRDPAFGYAQMQTPSRAGFGAYRPGEVCAQPVSLTWLPKTVMELLGFADSEVFAGQQLLKRSVSDPNVPDAAVPSAPAVAQLVVDESLLADSHPATDAVGTLQSVIGNGYSYISHANGRIELYQWKTDPGETQDLSRRPEFLPSRKVFQQFLQYARNKSAQLIMY